MRDLKRYKRISFCFLLIVLITSVKSVAQTTVRGAITDAKTGEAIPFVTVFFEGTAAGATTDFNGQYFIESKDSTTRIRFSLLGYKTEFREVKYNQSQILSLKLTADVQELKTVDVKGEKKRYKNKNNPAVDLIRKVIDHKKDNRKESIEDYQFEKYEKVQFALSNISEKFKNKRYLKKFQFIFDNLDSNQMPGKVILPMYLKETLSDVYYRKKPKDSKEIIKGTKSVDFQDIGNNDGVATFIAYLYQDVDIYKNTLPILTNSFISPISDNGPLYYRYYIKDTVFVEGKKCYHMTFYPRNKSDFSFMGELYITFDSLYAVRKCELTVSPEINLNFVKELTLVQNFKEVEPGEWLVRDENISIDFGIGKNGLGIYGQRALSYKEFVLNQPQPDSLFSGLKIITLDSATARNDSYWDDKRHGELTQSEKGTYTMVDSIQKIPAFKRAMNILVLVFAGYEDIGKVEIGPVSTFYSYNPVEGSRFRFGGRTTLKYSPNIRYEGYAVYGTTDEKWKYFAGLTKTLGKKNYIDFPQRNLILSYQYETKIPGQELQFVQEDNAFLSFKRGRNDKLLYNEISNAEINIEYPSHFSYNLQLQHVIQAPGGNLYFNKVSYNDSQYNIESITTTQANLTLRFAPWEQFYQGKNYRIPMFNNYPILELRYRVSVKDFLKSDYTFHQLAFRFFKRFNVAPFGYSDITFDIGKVFGRVPYPLLQIHRANQTYSYQLQSYNLMNFLEFMSDEWTGVNWDHYFNGFFFNKIPLFKRLKWREVMTLKVLWGRITDNNNPDLHPELFKLPLEADGAPLTYSLEKKPYVEVSVGVMNIFKFIRVDLLKRLTYLEHDNISQFGIRTRLKFDF